MEKMSEWEERREEYWKIARRSPQIAHVLGHIYPPPGDSISLVGTYVLAPSLGGFVQWLLYEAIKSGKKRLYFLARDGYFPYRAALIFCERYHLPIECHYLSCSRYSIRLPLFHLNREEALSYVCRGGIDTTLEKILRRAGLNEKERREVVQCLSLPFSSNKVLSRTELSKIRLRLDECETFLTFMDRHSREAMPGLVGYLRQEGLLDNVSDAVVDSGWLGSMQKTLQDALTYMGRTRRLEGYYWGLYDLPSDAVLSDYHTYYFEPGKHLLEKVNFNNCLFEAVYSAPHGMTLYYRREGKNFVPYYGHMGQNHQEFAKKIEGYLLAYIRLLAETQNGFFVVDNIRKERQIIRSLLERFMGEPSRDEAEVFGSLLFSDDVLEGEEQQIAAPLTENVLNAHRLFLKIFIKIGIKKERIWESTWYEGSVVRSEKQVKRRLKEYRIYQFVRQLRNLLRYYRKRWKK